jgi:hypothetical protein
MTIVTICDSVLERLKAVSMRLDLESTKVWFRLALFETFCDSQFLYYQIRHIVTVTNVTIFDDSVTRLKRSQWRRLKKASKVLVYLVFLWWLKAVTMRLVFKSFKSLVFASLVLLFFFTFCDGQLLYYKNHHIVTICDKLVTICDKFVIR